MPKIYPISVISYDKEHEWFPSKSRGILSIFSATSFEASKLKHNAMPAYRIRNTIETQKKYQTQMEREIQYEEEFPGVSMAWRNPKQRHRGRMKLARVLNGIERMTRIFLV